MALAVAAKFEGERIGVRAGAVIIEHGLQEITKTVAARTADELRARGLHPVVIREVKVAAKGSPEAAARNARYEAIDEVAAEHDAKFVMLAHTLDDQAETVLLGLARGSGNRSLNGMAEVNGRYLRPLLSIHRATTMAFCADISIEPWHDPHNFDEKYSRVRVRKNVLPILETELGPGVADALARSAEMLREDELVLAELAESYFSSDARMKSTSIEFAVASLKLMPLAIRHRVIALALEALGAPEFARVHIRAIDDLIDDWHGQKPLALPGVRVERTGEVVALKTTKTLKPGAC